MPSLGYQEDVYVRAEAVPLEIKFPKPVFEAKFDIIPFNGKDYKGVVKCSGYVIDAFRGYSICKIEDEKGDVLFSSGWIVDLDPEKELRAASYSDAPVKYFIVSKREFLDSSDVQITVDDVKKKFEQGKKLGGKYVGILGYILPTSEFLREIKENPELKAEREKIVGEFEEELEKIFSQ